jgi:hypothetical protein
VDPESYAVLQRAAADEVGLPATLAHRLRGESFAELRGDAKRALRDFGIAEPPPSDERGRFTMSDQIRAASGRPLADATLPEQPVAGDLGIGRGGSALARQSQPPSMNDLLRAAAGVRTTIVADLAEQYASERAS